MRDRDSILYENINSPNTSIAFFFMIASIAAKEGRIVKTLDIGGAYLNADILAHGIYMELDPTISAILV